ncbi:MAG: NAD-dependent epimerase/dehydratase [Deltaproteobacteria bacterium]|nr:NAD-dependent epimerase/dehydratase [Deltaproteobacteria bacterium]
MKILVTGGAGYVGSLLIPMLLERGDAVVCFDNFLWGFKPLLHCATHPNLEIIRGDIRDRKAVGEALHGCDTVLHLAAIVGYPACAADPHRAISTNVEGTKHVVEQLDGRRLIFASTGSTYGKVEGVATEATPIAPLTLYGKTKWEAERMIVDAGGVALRFATVFGVAPRLRLDLLVNDFAYQAIHNKQIVLFEGHFRRTFLHAKDAAQSYCFALEHYDRMRGSVYNIGDDGMNFTKRDVAMRLKRLVDFYLHEADVGTDLDARNYEVSYAKINALGFATRVGFDAGLAELVKVLRHVTILNEWRNA